MKHFYSLFLLIAVTACQQEEKIESFVIHIPESPPSQTIQLSSLMDDIEVIRLETNDSTFLPASFKVQVTENYLITMSDGYILEFDRKGNFVRKLAQKGSGPNEFMFIQSTTADPENEKLYYRTSSDPDHIRVIDLRSGLYENAILLPTEEITAEGRITINNLYLSNDTTLICVLASPVQPTRYQLFYLSTAGNLLDGIPKDENIADFKMTLYFTFSQQIDQSLWYKPFNNDTLFSVAGKSRQPRFSFDIENPYQPETLTGNYLNFQIAGSSFIIFKNEIVQKGVMYRYTSSERTASSEGIPNGLHYLGYLNLENQEVVQIDSINLSELPITLTGKDLKIQSSGAYGILTLDAVMFKELVGEALDNSTLSAEVREDLSAMDQSVSELDNPILIIGKLK